MNLTPSQQHGIRVRIDFARQELDDLQRYRELTWLQYQSDRDARRIVERIIENVANALLDISKILLSSLGQPTPGTYREIMLALAAAELAPEDLAQDLATLAGLRNTLAHRYLDYKWDGIRWFLGHGMDRVTQWLNRCEELLPGDSDS
ncbi:type VII toxin-antitoxin system HepT family RNase toxin [Thermaerobacter litoralis]